MIRIYGTALASLADKEESLRAEIPSAWLAVWEHAHPNLRRPDARLASLAGIWLLARGGGVGALSYDEGGKPQLTGSAISITHTDTYALCAISDQAFPIGLDAEDLCQKMPPERREAMAKRWFSPAERARARENEEAFLRIWTRKEAYVKRAGTGLRELSSIDTEAVDCRFLHTRVKNTLVTLACSKEEQAREEIVLICERKA